MPTIRFAAVARDLGTIAVVRIIIGDGHKNISLDAYKTIFRGDSMELEIAGLGTLVDEKDIRDISLITTKGERIRFFKWGGLWYEESQYDTVIANALWGAGT